MAETRRGDIVVKMILDTSQADAKLKETIDKFNQISQAVKATGLKDFQKDINNLAQSASGNLTPVFLQLNYIIQDLPYGFRGIANNIQMLSQSIIYLRAQGLGLRDIFVEFINLFKGPLGILFLISSAVSLIQMLTLSQSKLAKETEKSSKEFENFNKKITDLRSDIENLNLSYREVNKQINEFAKELNISSDALIKISERVNVFELMTSDIQKLSQETEKMEKNLADFTKGIDVFGKGVEMTTTKSDKLKAKVGEINKEFSKTYNIIEATKELKKYQTEIENVIKASMNLSGVEFEKFIKDKPIKLLSLALEEMRKRLEETSAGNVKVIENYKRGIELLENTRKKLLTVEKEKIDKDKEMLEIMKAKANLEDDEIVRVEKLAEVKMKELEIEYKRGQISKELFEIKKLEIAKEVERERAEIEEKRFRERQRMLEEELKTEQRIGEIFISLKENEFEKIKLQYELQLYELKRSLELGLISQEEAALRRLEIEQNYLQQVTEMRVAYFRDLISALSILSKQGTDFAKALAIANAIMNTYEGATKALAKYPPPFSFALAALTVAAGLAYVAKIASTSYQRGGFTGFGRKDEPAGIVHKGEFVFESDIAMRERENLEALRGALKTGVGLKDLISPRAISTVERVIEKHIPLRIENKIEINADLDYLKFFVREFQKYNKFMQTKTR